MSFIRNFLDSPIKRNGKEPELLKTCCYYFSLKAGCRLIALFEALISVLAMYWSHQEVREVRTSTTELLDLAFTREPVEELFGPETSGPILSANPYFSNALNTLTLLNSLILAVGTELASISCLVLWFCITILSTTIDTLYQVIQGNDLCTMFILVISLLLKMYFCAVVASLILKLQDKLNANVSESEVLYTQSEEA